MGLKSCLGRVIKLEILQKVLLGWELIFKNIGYDTRKVIFLIPFSAAVSLLIYVSVGRTGYMYKKLRFTIEKDRKSILRRLTEWLIRYKYIKRILTYIAVKTGMYSEYSFRRNLEIAAVLIFICFVLLILVLFVVLPRAGIIWYMFLVNLSVAALFITLVLYVLNTAVKIRFTSKLPQTFKLLNSRYISKENILKAIHLSLYEYDDFEKPVKKVMRVINDVLNKNNMDEIDETFKAIENTYNNEHLTLLLNLIRQAHYNGGKKVIKEQFEHATEDILSEIENQRDLAAAGRSYIILALLMPAGTYGIEKFNELSLGEKAISFYSSLTGIEFKVLFFAVLVVYISYMLLLERTI